MNADRLKHLELIQQIITRMAGNSFLLKGWSVTLLSALLAIAAGNEIYQIVIVAFLPCLMFWFLDGYFLRQERLYRRLWDEVRKQPAQATDFSMDTSALASQEQAWLRVCVSRTLLLFHGTLVLVLAAVALWTYCQ